ncbi:MAG: extracellular solute-binding protein [Proteobacteria bacterium]|nr:extracellular solute-binding protein [Pseudomonadota bacterium]
MREITRFAAGLAGLMLGAAPMAAAQEVTLDFPTWQLEEPGVSDWWKGLIQAFEAKHPGAKIKAYQIPFTQYVKQLTVRFAAATPPDIVHLPSRDFASFADQGWLAPLDDLLKSTDIPKAWPPLQADMTWKGATQGVLLMGYSSMLYFNQQLLDAAKVAVPKTPAEFLAALQATTNREKGIFGLSSTTVEHPNIVVEMGTWIVGLGQNWFKDGKYDLTNPKVVEAVDMYRRSVGFAPPGTNSATARQLFLDGKTAFLRDGPWVWAALAKAPAAVAPHLKMAELPFPVFTGGASNSLHMPAKLDARKKDLV